MSVLARGGSNGRPWCRRGIWLGAHGRHRHEYSGCKPSALQRERPWFEMRFATLSNTAAPDVPLAQVSSANAEAVAPCLDRVPEAGTCMLVHGIDDVNELNHSDVLMGGGDPHSEVPMRGPIALRPREPCQIAGQELPCAAEEVKGYALTLPDAVP